MKKVISLVGARPQFIKEAMIHLEISKKNPWHHILVHSGQHYDVNMSGLFFDELKMQKPDYFMEIGSGNHGAMTAAALERFENILLKEKPDMVIVYGDTNTTVAGALSAAKLKIPVAHIEAGIRQEPKDMPEEINRVVTDHLSSSLFTCYCTAEDNLVSEGIDGNSIYNVGDVMYDLFLAMRPNFNAVSLMEKHDLKKEGYILVTLHRDFNVDNPDKLRSVLDGLVSLKTELGLKIFFPIHPRTSKRVVEYGLEDFLDEFEISEPIGYFELMGLTENCAFVITDSGGFQKEAYFAKKRALVIMPDTGWRELTDAGWNVLTDPDSLQILEKGRSMVQKSVVYPSEIYGDGRSAEKIVSTLSVKLNS